MLAVYFLLALPQLLSIFERSNYKSDKNQVERSTRPYLLDELLKTHRGCSLGSLIWSRTQGTFCKLLLPTLPKGRCSSEFCNQSASAALQVLGSQRFASPSPSPFRSTDTL